MCLTRGTLLSATTASSEAPSAAAALCRWLQRSSLRVQSCKINLQAGSTLLLPAPTALCSLSRRKPHCHRADGWVLAAARLLLLHQSWGKRSLFHPAEPPRDRTFCSRSMVHASAWERQEGRKKRALEMRSIRNFNLFPPLTCVEYMTLPA